MAEVVYVVARSQAEFLKWIGKQDPNGTDPDPDTVYRYYRADVGTRGKHFRWLFLAGWDRRPEAEWRPVYHKALTSGKRWWQS
jgi:hypothetical protein